MKRLFSMLALTPVFLVGAFASGAAAQSAPAAAPAAPAASVLTAPVTGTTTTGAPFSGLYTVTQFANQNGQLATTGTLTGVLTDPTLTGGSQAIDPTTITLPAALSGSCRILDLTLGPLHLDLLGLIVDLNQVHLTITAQQGPGNLLGNLLCAVANLLNRGNTGGLANLLNNLLGL